MNEKHTKKVIPISIDRIINDIMDEKFSNKSRYVEWLIYQDLCKNLSNDDRLKKIIL